MESGHLLRSLVQWIRAVARRMAERVDAAMRTATRPVSLVGGLLEKVRRAVSVALSLAETAGSAFIRVIEVRSPEEAQRLQFLGSSIPPTTSSSSHARIMSRCSTLRTKGVPLGKLNTGAGVDDIDYVDATHLLYVAAGKAARLTVARLDDGGQLAVVATGETSEGARNAVADANGTAYVADSQQARLLVFKPAATAL